MLAESWRAGLTVTTFVQLFESLAGPANRQSMKLPALRDSVIVLDEPQSLPLDWWKLVSRLVAMLVEQYDATVIAMTATQPELFDDATKLVDDPDTYFEAVERVTYELDTSTERYIDEQSGPKSYDDAADALCESLNSDESALAVCNTIDSARELTERVSDATEVDVSEAYADELAAVGDVDSVDPAVVVGRVVESGENALLHLSTRLRPADRLTLIETAKQLTDRDYPLCVVSTQLVEAGVDISFDRVYRDLAPIDSIVQAAGRCNRSFERSRGRVTVWWLDTPGEQSKTPAEAVYNRGTSLLPVAADTLDSARGEDGTLSETAVAREAIENYYERLHDEKDVGKQTFADYVDESRADELARLSLIDQRRAADVFVCRTDAERELAEGLREAYLSYDFETLGRLLDETKPLRVSIPYYREDSETAEAIRDLPPLIEDEGLYRLNVRRYTSHFDRRTGFVVPDGGIDHQFI
jgi:CRISPR-associated endonuclease/helicase Cas3/CRISPR-associated endonuclease Cas3-HD